jgi:Zn-finger nucleic acid-binding protein
VNQLCQQCHAQVAPSEEKAVNLTRCPACGGKLVPDTGQNLDAPNAPPRQADRRGILLPRRHAVGGVITPR